ncbi:UNVERIFIED_CONTAM: hypothetical protein FKN15_044385 [Acipenser sinensis]
MRSHFYLFFSACLGSCRSHSAIEWFSQIFPEKKRLKIRFLRLFDDVGQGPTLNQIGIIAMLDQFNFVGKLLGPRGNSLKRLQEETLTKMSILGKGSMKEKEKEEELRKSGEAKYQHLSEDLHVLIEVFAPPAEAYARMGHALDEIKKFLIPDYNDEIRQAQLQELTYLNGGSEDAEVPAVRGKPIARGRGTPTPGLPRFCVKMFVYCTQLSSNIPEHSHSRLSLNVVIYWKYTGPRFKVYSASPNNLHPYTSLLWYTKEYDDGYGTAFDDQGYDSYDNNYNDQGQKCEVLVEEKGFQSGFDPRPCSF